MKIKVTKATGHGYWYRRHIGREFEVLDNDGVDYRVEDTGPGDIGFILIVDAVVVHETKIVEVEGVKYEVPSWANHLTRDTSTTPAPGSLSEHVFAWENEPTWTGTGTGYRYRNNSKRQRVFPYVEPKPVGHFNVAV